MINCFHIVSHTMNFKGEIMTTKTKVTKQGRLLEALLRGQKLTAKQIAAKFGIANPTATVSDIRGMGFSVTLDRATNKSGRTVSKYTLA